MRRIALILALALAGCAADRPLRPVIANPHRVPKKFFSGTYLYLKSVTQVKFPGRTNYGLLPGEYLESDKLIEFVLRERRLDVVAVNPLWQSDRPIERNTLLATFPIRHVDVLRKQNADGKDTNEEEETEIRRPWKDREFIVLDPGDDELDVFATQTDTRPEDSTVTYDDKTGYLQFTSGRHLRDQTAVSECYAFLPFKPSPTYRQKEYPRELQTRFGYFKTTTFQFDKYGRITTDDRREFMNRWDTSKPIVYYLSPSFPEHLKPVAREVIAGWNEAFIAASGGATGKAPLVLKEENTGQLPGDLRYNLIHYDDAPDQKHDVLGYGPSFTNPRTGEIVKADVFLYGNTLRRSVLNERLWLDLMDTERRPQAGGDSSDGGTSPYAQLVFPALGAWMPRWGAPTPDSRTPFNDPYRDLSPATLIPRFRAEMLSDLGKRISRFPAGISSLPSRNRNGRVSDEAIETGIFRPLLAHEMGHDLGLRHNFKGSADPNPRHVEPGSKTASVMDYNFLITHEPRTVAPYDRAAIKVAYGSDPETLADLIAENFYYCTDEQVFDSRDAMCNPYDAGTTLVETVQNQLKRYTSSYVFNNFRMGRVYFPDDISGYVRRVGGILIPFRQIYDNAAAIIKARGSNERLWYLLRQRIEADKENVPTPETVTGAVGGGPASPFVIIRVSNDMTAEIGTGELRFRGEMVSRRLDKRKIDKALADAQLAKVRAFQAMSHVILYRDRDNIREDYDVEDMVHGDIQRRGVLPDRMMGLLLAGMRLPDPVVRGLATTPYSSFDEGVEDRYRGMVPELLAGVVSNTLFGREELAGRLGGRGVASIDYNVRELAFDLIGKDLAIYGESAESRELLSVERVTIDVAAVTRRLELEKQLFARLLSLGAVPSVPPGALSNPLDFITASYATGIALQAQDPAIVSLHAEIRRLESPVPAARREEELYLQSERTKGHLKTLIKALYKDGIRDTEKNEIRGKIRDLDTERARLGVAYARLAGGNVFLKAPLLIPGRTLRTATGYLIHDSINRAESALAAFTELSAEATVQLRAEEAKEIFLREHTTIAKLRARIDDLGEECRSIERFLAAERGFAEKIHRWYAYGHQ